MTSGGAGEEREESLISANDVLDEPEFFSDPADVARALKKSIAALSKSHSAREQRESGGA